MGLNGDTFGKFELSILFAVSLWWVTILKPRSAFCNETRKLLNMQDFVSVVSGS